MDRSLIQRRTRAKLLSKRETAFAGGLQIVRGVSHHFYCGRPALGFVGLVHAFKETIWQSSRKAYRQAVSKAKREKNSEQVKLFQLGSAPSELYSDGNSPAVSERYAYLPQRTPFFVVCPKLRGPRKARSETSSRRKDSTEKRTATTQIQTHNTRATPCECLLHPNNPP